MESAVSRKNRVDMLNVVRFIAFIIVFCLHAKNFAPEGWNQSGMAWLTYTPAWAGVWIFFVLSGYGIGAGFFSHRYSLETWKDLCKFWWGRFKKIAPMYYLYIGFAVLFVNSSLLTPTKEHAVLLGKLLFFIYDPRVDNYGLGIVWYLCTLIKLYFVAPFLWLLLKKVLSSRKRTYVVLFLCVAGGLGLRILAREIMLKTGTGAWHIDVYKPFYMNLDLFAAGFCINQLKEKREDSSVWKKWISFLFLIVLILYNCKIYYTASVLQQHITAQTLLGNYWLLYQFVLPSVYAIAVLLVIRFWDIDRTYEYEKVTAKNVLRNPLRIFDKFPAVMMTCYLFHANVLGAVGNHIATEYVKADAGICHLVQLAAAFIITLIGAAVLSVINRPAGR